jgi:hypothetical protein
MDNYNQEYLGFGIHKNKKISDFKWHECDYLLWVLKKVRLPKSLWLTIIGHLETIAILDTLNCICDRNSLTQEEIEKAGDSLKLDSKLFLSPRLEPNIKYQCHHCNSENLGYPETGLVSENILCEKCNSNLLLEDEELRFYFGWYLGWRIKDFETIEDKEYLLWIINNLDNLPENFRRAIKKKINVVRDISL